ncbi:MAG TPA: nucleotidyl transferase AbiEii/AbiGii toxin family protein [Arenimonas sp.]|nr:nucleotidyl transferase AbiEii/AbiGii toxin family protein [Arenimonas sp.]
MFERAQHRRIAAVLTRLDADFLRSHHCYFGGGTAIAMRYGEYRESVDIDLLVSDSDGYRALRQRLAGARDVSALLRAGAELPEQAREVRADQYGIRATLAVEARPIKFEIVREARIVLDAPSAMDTVCGIATLTPLDLAASKLLANSDRWNDDGVFSRDVIDLAMMAPRRLLLLRAIAKAEAAYGDAIRADLGKALDRIARRDGWLERCMQAMAMSLPKAVLLQRLRALRRVLD